ncbi:hypothetical protein B0H10DRAFT_2436764 [Mycena sp. CBHHK59/15]|nr:hypothetical protein B0H10DRAFT_2436764 [Mycena sp. CBHHK59/15]
MASVGALPINHHEPTVMGLAPSVVSQLVPATQRASKGIDNASKPSENEGYCVARAGRTRNNAEDAPQAMAETKWSSDWQKATDDGGGHQTSLEASTVRSAPSKSPRRQGNEQCDQARHVDIRGPWRHQRNALNPWTHGIKALRDASSRPTDTTIGV